MYTSIIILSLFFYTIIFIMIHNKLKQNNINYNKKRKTKTRNDSKIVVKHECISTLKTFCTHVYYNATIRMLFITRIFNCKCLLCSLEYYYRYRLSLPRIYCILWKYKYRQLMLVLNWMKVLKTPLFLYNAKLYRFIVFYKCRVCWSTVYIFIHKYSTIFVTIILYIYIFISFFLTASKPQWILVHQNHAKNYLGRFFIFTYIQDTFVI